MTEKLYIFIVTYKSCKSSKDRVKVLATTKWHAIQKAKAEHQLFQYDKFDAYRARAKAK